MQYSLQTLWQDVRFSAFGASDVDQKGNILNCCMASYMLTCSTLLFQSSKYTSRISIGIHVAFALGLEYLIHLNLIDIVSERNTFRALWILQTVCFNYLSSMGAQHCDSYFPLFKPLTQEERKSASTWQWFRRSCFFFRPLILGAGRWHTYIGTDSWRVAVLWRLSVALSVSLALVGSELGFINPRVLIYGIKFGFISALTLCSKDEATTRNHAIKSDTSATPLSENKTILQGAGTID